MKIKLFDNKEELEEFGMKLFILLSVLFLALDTGIQRNMYLAVIPKSNLENELPRESSLEIETTSQKNYRNKLMMDIKYHDLKKNTNQNPTTQILINQEGKIVGYKFCNIFYPNYFTRQQPRSIIKAGKKFKIKKLHFCIAKIHKNNTKCR
nr:hypothetical protein [Chroomonas collegionis]